ncbi:MAG TPA: ATP synthase F1 subunit delta [Polyangia bacterium]|nr:ATP synthase F1 subunit delta [Polyangia bacterium]
MLSGSIARRWAKALFDLGEEQQTLIAGVRDVQRAAEVWTESPELRQTVTNPLLTERTRRAVWTTVMDRLGAGRHVRGFLNLLFDKGRLAELPAIARELQVLGDRRDGRLRAEVASAGPLDDETVNRIRAAMQKSTGKAVVMTRREDPELLGGVVTRVGDLIFDGSLRTRLSRIKDGMLGRA